MGSFRQQSPGKVLQAHPCRQKAARKRGPRVGANHGHCGPLLCAAGRDLMRKLRASLLRLAGLFRKSARDVDLAAEIESHLQLHIDDNLRSGMSADEARRAALLKLGGVESLKESYRDRRSLPTLEAVLQSLRFGARSLRKTPGFTLLAIGLFSLGIGASTALFSVI